MHNKEKTIQELFNLKNKVALITGAIGRLGPPMSRALAELGAHVIVGSRSMERAAKFADELKADGYQASAAAIDISDEKNCKDVINDIKKTHGRLDILINNAYSFLEKRIDEITNEEINKTLESGLTGTFRLCQLASELMKENGGGSIINIGSMYGMVGSYPETYKDTPACISPSYHMAKGGLLQLTRYLSVYWAEFGIRVNSLSPGPFPAESVREQLPDFMNKLEAKVPLKRIGRPEELKGAIALMASEAGSYMTGQNIIIDGGWTAW